MNFRKTIVCLFIAGGMAGSGLAGETVPNRSGEALSILHAIDAGFTALFERVAPSVVVIEARKKPGPEEEPDESKDLDFLLREDGKPEDGPGNEDGNAPKENKRPPFRLPLPSVQSEGSGFVIRADGYLLTNYHVVAEAVELEVRFKDGRKLPAKLVGFDERTDIAVLKVEAKGLATAELGDSEKLRVGQLVGAIGAPFSQDYSFTVGWVSGKGRSNLLGATSSNVLYEDYIQTDAFINPGNSGGPLFDVDGRVIGMNTLINGVGRGLAFAIPSNMLADVSNQLITKGKVQRPWLGIRVDNLSNMREIRERVPVEQGVVVRTIEAEAPAYRSDLRPADIITAVDGTKVATAHDLQKVVLGKKVGQTLQLTVWRAGTTLTLPVVTGELPGNFSKTGANTPKRPVDAKPEGPVNLGLTMKDGAEKGAVVAEVAVHSPAAVADVRVGDVITAIEGKAVATGAEATAALASLPAGKNNVLLNLERKGRRTFVVVER